jgi:drug/metabolite transporter (DMT)-like permease
MRKATLSDIALWFALAAMWSSSYAIIKIGVAAIEPTVLVAGRLLTGGAVLYLVLRLHGMSLSRQPADWISYTVTGMLGSAIPFLLITYGEQSVDSALASILMGTVPVVTMLLAAWHIPDETLTPRTAIGVLGGLAGVAILVGPTALSGLGRQLGGQVAIVGATFCYAASTVYIRRFVSRPPLEMATGAMIVGVVFLSVVILISGADIGSIEPTLSSLGTIFYLGLFSTACANLIYFYLVPRLGATRMSQVNFAVPVGGAILGTLILEEALTAQRLLALTIIMASVYLGTTKGKLRQFDSHSCNTGSNS